MKYCETVREGKKHVQAPPYLKLYEIWAQREVVYFRWGRHQYVHVFQERQPTQAPALSWLQATGGLEMGKGCVCTVCFVFTLESQ